MQFLKDGVQTVGNSGSATVMTEKLLIWLLSDN